MPAYQDDRNYLCYLSLEERLYRRWYEYNLAYFNGALLPLEITVDHIPSPSFGNWYLGQYYARRRRIVLEAEFLTGRHVAVRSGDQYAAGRFRVIADTLLHEMIHQYQVEVLQLKRFDASGKRLHHVHGKGFAEKANFIGQLLGLAPVSFTRDPFNKDWPHNVRPASYYLGAYSNEFPAGWAEQHWGQIFACAVQGYAEWGSGVVALLLNRGLQILAQAYQTVGHTELLDGHPIDIRWRTPWIEKQFTDYNPTREVLLVWYIQNRRFSKRPQALFRIPCPPGVQTSVPDYF